MIRSNRTPGTIAALRALAGTAALALAGTAANAQYLMVPDWTADKVMLFNATDGSLVNLNFIIESPDYPMSSPRAAIQVNDEIWVCDQVEDVIYRFTLSLTPTYISSITAGLDNLRGMKFIDGVVYVCNFGTANGAPGQAIIKFAPDGTNLGSFPVAGSAFDVVGFQGDLLVTTSDDDDILRYTTAGTLVGTFHDGNGTTGINFPQGIHTFPTGPGGDLEVWVAGFSPPVGAFRLSPAGAILQRYAAPPTLPVAPRSVYLLGNGRLFFNDGTALYTSDLTNLVDTVTVVSGINSQFINPLNIPAEPECPACPADFDQDGGVTGADVEAFFLAFEAGDPCGDTDLDGGVTGADVEAFFLAFEAGGCEP
jgi:hypothetical protein